MADDEGLEQLGEARDVEPVRERGALTRLILSLVGIGLLVGVLVALGAVIANGFARTEAGLCRITAFDCTQLSLASVESIAGIDLPDGTEVVSGYALEGVDELELRARVRLPEGAASPLGGGYSPVGEPAGGLPVAGLSDVEYWERLFVTSDASIVAASGTDGAGRVVVVFETVQQ
jgi:hypothetical protein